MPREEGSIKLLCLSDDRVFHSQRDMVYLLSCDLGTPGDGWMGGFDHRLLLGWWCTVNWYYGRCTRRIFGLSERCGIKRLKLMVNGIWSLHTSPRMERILCTLSSPWTVDLTWINCRSQFKDVFDNFKRNQVIRITMNTNYDIIVLVLVQCATAKKRV